MQDMLVKLYALPEDASLAQSKDPTVVIRRAMTPDMLQVVDFVRSLSGRFAVGECQASFQGHPVTCFIATRGSEILGYACYNATAPDYFGPTAVLPQERGKGIGGALLLRCLAALREEGYGYAIIGGVGPQAFYEKTVGAVLIPGSDPGIYKDFLGIAQN